MIKTLAIRLRLNKVVATALFVACAAATAVRADTIHKSISLDGEVTYST